MGARTKTFTRVCDGCRVEREEPEADGPLDGWWRLNDIMLVKWDALKLEKRAEETDEQFASRQAEVAARPRQLGGTPAGELATGHRDLCDDCGKKALPILLAALQTICPPAK